MGGKFYFMQQQLSIYLLNVNMARKSINVCNEKERNSIHKKLIVLKKKIGKKETVIFNVLLQLIKTHFSLTFVIIKRVNKPFLKTMYYNRPYQHDFFFGINCLTHQNLYSK